MVVALRDEETNNMQESCKSDEKRLRSLRAKKQQFRLKEQLVRDALKNLDKPGATKKIIFDDVDASQDAEIQIKNGKKRKDLFDNEEDAENDSGEFEIDINKNQKEVKLRQPLGNDNRFKIDSRFLENEDNHSNEPVGPEFEGDMSNLEEEKKWQLGLLENVLGRPVTVREKETQLSKKAKMIRYDPTASNHEDYEIKVNKAEPPEKKKKQKEVTKKDDEDVPPVEVSKEMFYSVSDTLKKSLNKEEGFSLLKMHGKEAENDAIATNNETITENASKQTSKFQFSFDSANPFKYDSSDNENEDDNTGKLEANETSTSDTFFARNDNLFFDKNDARFNEALKFFNEEAAPTGDFKVLRRELKQIVRAKIRNNVRKNKPGKVKRLVSNKKNKMKKR